jgi:hypothetical protein
MAASSRFAQVSFEEINEMKENATPMKTKSATKYGLKLFRGKIGFFIQFYRFI